METIETTQRGAELLSAMRFDGWLSRAELARATGKNRLSPHDVALLDRLVAGGVLEKRERESNTPVGIAYEYRLKPQS